MVYFTCNNCGESVKKPSVEKHYNTRCYNAPKNVSCMDCQKDFLGEEYVAHTKCISEVEKYSGKNYVPKAKQNCGQKKQEMWTDIVHSILESTEYQLSAQTRKIFQLLQNFENVPRKKAKFHNFVANCLRVNQKQAQPVWELLEKELENMKKAKQQEAATKTKAMEESKKPKEEPQQQNGLKRKLDDNVQEDEGLKKKTKAHLNSSISKENGAAEVVTEDANTFQWSTSLEKIISKHPEGLLLDKLKKKLLKKYKTKLDLEDLNEKQHKKFEKKFSKALQKCPMVQMDDDVVKLNCS